MPSATNSRTTPSASVTRTYGIVCRASSVDDVLDHVRRVRVPVNAGRTRREPAFAAAHVQLKRRNRLRVLLVVSRTRRSAASLSPRNAPDQWQRSHVVARRHQIVRAQRRSAAGRCRRLIASSRRVPASFDLTKPAAPGPTWQSTHRRCACGPALEGDGAPASSTRDRPGRRNRPSPCTRRRHTPPSETITMLAIVKAKSRSAIVRCRGTLRSMRGHSIASGGFAGGAPAPLDPGAERNQEKAEHEERRQHDERRRGRGTGWCAGRRDPPETRPGTPRR